MEHLVGNIQTAYSTSYHAQYRKMNNMLNGFSAIISSKCHLCLASPDHTPTILIVHSCQVDVSEVAVVLLDSAVLHVEINEVHMPSRDRCER
jgi:hypothetical protein